MAANHIKQKVAEALASLDIHEIDIPLVQTEHTDHGDYASSVALKLAKQLKKSPLDIATSIAKKLQPDSIIEKVVVAPPGFINIFLTIDYAIQQALLAAAHTFSIPSFHYGDHKRVIFEFAHPNTLKLFHIGHLRNITTGEALSRIFAAAGNTVIRANYQGDVGMHIAKTLWEIRNIVEKSGLDSLRELPLREKIATIGKAYAAGNAAFESDEASKAEIIDINKKIYTKDPEIMPLWEETRKWSLDYFDTIYKLVDTTFDRFYFESQMAERGVTLSKEAVEKGILKEDDGAIIFDGSSHGLDTRVFVNRLGYPTYEGKELALAEKEFSENGSIDRLTHVLGGEQISFSQVTFKVEELLGIIKPEQKHHLVYGKVDVKNQKMSSRKGNVIEGEWLIEEAKKTITSAFETDDDTAQKLAIAAVKYEFLKNGILTRVDFDLESAVNIHGKSGPYLLYTYVRTQSILKKVLPTAPAQSKQSEFALEEQALFRFIAHYTETIEQAARNTAPNLIAGYLYDLAQLFNAFYQKHPILKAESPQLETRLLLTRATGSVLKHGLQLLGIETVKKM